MRPPAGRGRGRGPAMSAEEVDRHIVEVLGSVATPLGAYDLLAQLPAPFTPRYPTSIYRALDRLCAAGLVERVETLSAFRLRDRPDAVLAVCRGCGHVRSYAAAVELQAIRVLLARHAFEIDRLVVEAIGRCRACLDPLPSR